MKITDLYIYPLKSGRGIRLDYADVTLRGLKHDRTMMVVDVDGRFITQRDNPILAMLNVAVDAVGATFRKESAPDLTVAWDEFTTDANAAVQVWKSAFNVSGAPNRADQWFSDILGQPARLVFQRDHQIREIRQDRAPGGIVSFADGYPFLVASTASLHDLNDKIAARGGAPVTMDRFRPNIVVEGLDPWAEDQIGEIAFGDMHFKFIRPCSRCVMTTIDQHTAQKMGKEPLATLARFRMDPTWDGAIFGENAYSLQTGTLTVGQEGRVLAPKNNLNFQPSKLAS